MSDFKSIADVPEMLELWDFDKNPEDPKTVSSISRLPYYWKCKLCGYEGLQRLVPVPAPKGNVLPAKEPGKDPIPLKMYHF